MTESLDFKNVDDIKNEIERLEYIKRLKKNEEQSLKILINSIYGVFGTTYFIGYNPDIAESVTLQGQSIIKYTIKKINSYFKDIWHTDNELHQKLNLNSVFKIEDNVVIYSDTDSVFISFDSVLKSCDYQKDPVDFILNIYKYRLKEYLNKSFKLYSKAYKTDCLLDLEFEKISESVLFLGKKNYILNIAYKEPGVRFESLTNIVPVGVEFQRSVYPSYIRNIFHELSKYILKEGNNLNIRNLLKMISNYKKEFKQRDIDDICFNVKISDYEKYVLDDKESLNIRKGTPIHIKAAAVHNLLINRSKKYKNKYNLIKSGDKVRYYYTLNNPYCDVFGFVSGVFPVEIAYSVDYDTQFDKIVLNPINRYVTALGYDPISSNLSFVNKLI